jgi:DNA modification methylase
MSDKGRESNTGKTGISGPQKGDFVAPPQVADNDERSDALPQQEEFWRPPVRFGSVPIEKEPLGWDRRRGFRKLFPQVSLPFQVVERVSFGHPELEPNQLFWGDNLHVMRQLPSESIDLIYVDPPFFSGRHYNVIFGDQNELRSFSDIWEGGMPGYLIWLNARLYEMKRLLKNTGTIFVHLDWHAVHYLKVEMDKIFGADKFLNEISWRRSTPTGGKVKSKMLPRDYDSILWYSKGANWYYQNTYLPYSEDYIKKFFYHDDGDGRRYMLQTVGDYSKESIEKFRSQGRVHVTKNGAIRLKQYLNESKGILADDIWTDIRNVRQRDTQRMTEKESIGYPTQKPEALLERIMKIASKEGAVVADFFGGGGTTPAVAQRLGFKWIACDQSRVAVAITADRLTRQVEEQTGRVIAVPDFTIEHWGIYETRRLAETPPDQFRQFVLRAFGAVPEEQQNSIHGMKGALPVWVGEADQKMAATAKDVQDFANAIRKTLRYQQDNLREGIMLAWAFRPDAVEAAERLRKLEQADLNFVRLEQVRIDSPRFREHVATLSTDHAD